MTSATTSRPDADLRGLRAAHALLLDDLNTTDLEATDFDPAAPSLLPGWSIAHVITHLARNADAVTAMFEAAARGEIGDQYPGGAAQRSGDIEAGAGRSRSELLRDITTACARLDLATAEADDEIWAHGVGRSVLLGELPLASWPFRRWREVEIHHADLGLAFAPDHWSEPFVAREWSLAIAQLGARVSGGGLVLAPSGGDPITIGDGGTVVAGRQRALLAWMLGRAEIAGAPAITPYP